MGMIKTLTVITNLVMSYGKDPFASIELIELNGYFLIATILFHIWPGYVRAIHR